MREVWPIPTSRDDKYSRGVVGVDTGSSRYPGAAILSTLGAIRSGASFIRYCGATEAKSSIIERCPSSTFGAGRVNAWVLGCGWDDEEDNVPRLAQRLADGVPTVIDAGALGAITSAMWSMGMKYLPAGCLLTPHAGELARLLGVHRSDVEGDPISYAARLSWKLGAAVLIKGSIQYCVVGPWGSIGRVATVTRGAYAVNNDMVVYRAYPGPAWTAQAGSGDILAGVAGTLLAAGIPSVVAGALAASLQAMTAIRHQGPWAPDQLADWFPETVAWLVS